MIKLKLSIVRNIILLLSLWLCNSCYDEMQELRGGELCREMSNAKSYKRNSKVLIDSLVTQSAGLSSAERYAVLFHAVQYSLDLQDTAKATYYLHSLDSLTFPDTGDKTIGFLLLDCYDTVGHNLLSFAPHLFDPKWIASLLFDMENCWSLSPQEQLYFQVLKSGIYFNIFKEYKSAMMIVHDSFNLVRQSGANQEMIMNLFRVLIQSSLRLEESDQMVDIGDDFAKIAATTPFDSLVRESVFQTTGIVYEQQGNYQKAYEWLSQTGKFCSGIYSNLFTRVFVGMDDIPAALAYIERKRKENPHTVILAGMLWDEAGCRRKAGDEAGYERCLQEAIALFDRFPECENEVNGCAPSEAYARMLWQQGRKSDAIRRMELVTDKLISGQDFSKIAGVSFFDLAPQIDRLRLLRDYYRSEGRLSDALRQSLLCDSLEQRLADARLQAERRKTTTAVYTMDLVRNLEAKRAEFLEQRQKLYITYFILFVALSAVTILVVFFHQHKRQLNVLYSRQKEIEHLQTEKRQMVSSGSEQLSPEEQLFRDLERQFYQEELFRNPGFSRDDLCLLGGSNRMYVSTCINKYAGTNINQWINKARVDYAIRLIGEGERDLLKISEKSGFSSDKTFFRSFKQFTNLTPRQYIVREKQEKE